MQGYKDEAAVIQSTCFSLNSTISFHLIPGLECEHYMKVLRIHTFGFCLLKTPMTRLISYL